MNPDEKPVKTGFFIADMTKYHCLPLKIHDDQFLSFQKNTNSADIAYNKDYCRSEDWIFYKNYVTKGCHRVTLLKRQN